MTSKKILSGITFSLVAVLAITMITGFEFNETIAEESTEKKYKMVNDVDIIGEFQYGNGKGTELVEFQVFTQNSGFNKMTDAVEFTLVKEVDGKSPYLYEVADIASQNSNAPRHYSSQFDVRIMLAQGSEILREFDYGRCIVDNYKIETLYDKEEGWMGKGFAPIDEFTITCNGYSPENPLLEKKPTTTSNQVSSSDLIDGKNPAFG